MPRNINNVFGKGFIVQRTAQKRFFRLKRTILTWTIPLALEFQMNSTKNDYQLFFNKIIVNTLQELAEKMVCVTIRQSSTTYTQEKKLNKTKCMDSEWT